MRLSSLIVFSALASVASATSFTSSTAFLAAATVTQTENFGTLTNGQLISSGSTINGLTYSNFALQNGATQLDITNAFNSFSGISLGVDHSADAPGLTFFFGNEGATISFASPITAFGMFFNVNLNSGTYGFTSSAGDASTDSTVADTSTFVFAGLVSATPFSSITFSSSDVNLGSYNVTELLLESATGSVPEPASISFMMAGIAAFGLAGWKRRRTLIAKN